MSLVTPRHLAMVLATAGIIGTVALGVTWYRRQGGKRDNSVAASTSPEFEDAVARSRRLPDNLPTSTKLELYGLYKASTMPKKPDPREDAPSMLDMVGRAKFEAWCEASQRFPGVEDAATAYVDLVIRLCAQHGVVSEGTNSKSRGSGGMRSVSKMRSDESETTRTSEKNKTSIEYQKAKALFEENMEDDCSDALEELFQGNPRLAEEVDEDRRTLLHWAIDSSSLWAAKVLVERHGADVNAKDYEGSTPLMYAAMGDLLEAARFLLSRGADASATMTTPEGDREDFASLASSELLSLLPGNR